MRVSRRERRSWRRRRHREQRGLFFLLPTDATSVLSGRPSCAPGLHSFSVIYYYRWFFRLAIFLDLLWISLDFWISSGSPLFLTLRTPLSSLESCLSGIVPGSTDPQFLGIESCWFIQICFSKFLPSCSKYCLSLHWFESRWCDIFCILLKLHVMKIMNRSLYRAENWKILWKHFIGLTEGKCHEIGYVFVTIYKIIAHFLHYTVAAVKKLSVFEEANNMAVNDW